MSHSVGQESAQALLPLCLVEQAALDMRCLPVKQLHILGHSSERFFLVKDGLTGLQTVPEEAAAKLAHSDDGLPGNAVEDAPAAFAGCLKRWGGSASLLQFQGWANGDADAGTPGGHEVKRDVGGQDARAGRGSGQQRVYAATRVADCAVLGGVPLHGEPERVAALEHPGERLKLLLHFGALKGFETLPLLWQQQARAQPLLKQVTIAPVEHVADAQFAAGALAALAFGERLGPAVNAVKKFVAEDGAEGQIALLAFDLEEIVADAKLWIAGDGIGAQRADDGFEGGQVEQALRPARPLRVADDFCQEAGSEHIFAASEGHSPAIGPPPAALIVERGGEGERVPVAFMPAEEERGGHCRRHGRVVFTAKQLYTKRAEKEHPYEILNKPVEAFARVQIEPQLVPLAAQQITHTTLLAARKILAG